MFNRVLPEWVEDVDWPDTLFHIAGGAVVMLIGLLLGYPVLAAVANTIFWPGREMYQRTFSFHDDWWNIFGVHKAAEAFPAPVLSWVVVLFA